MPESNISCCHSIVGKKTFCWFSLCVCFAIYPLIRDFFFCVIINIWDYDGKKISRMCEENKTWTEKSNMQKKNWDEHRFWSHQLFFAVQKQAFNLISMCSHCVLFGFFSSYFYCFGVSIIFISSKRTNKKKRERKEDNTKITEFAYDFTPSHNNVCIFRDDESNEHRLFYLNVIFLIETALITLKTTWIIYTDDG